MILTWPLSFLLLSAGVPIGGSLEALKKLETKLGIDLTSNSDGSLPTERTASKL